MRHLSKILIVILLLTSLGIFVSDASWSSNVYMTYGEKVPVDKVFSIRFSTPMDKDTINTRNIFVLEDNHKPFEVDLYYNATENKVYIIPVKYYQWGKSYNLYISPSLRDTLGRPIRNSIIMSFETESHVFTKEFQFNNISMGDTTTKVINSMGQPNLVLPSEQGFDWYVYRNSGIGYLQIGVKSGRVVAFYTNSTRWTSKSGIGYSSSKSLVNWIYGKGLEFIEKGGKRYIIDAGFGSRTEYEVFLIDGTYATMFYDINDRQRVTSVLIVDRTIEEEYLETVPRSSTQLRDSYERMLFELTNAARLRAGRSELAWDSRAASAARKHSIDMARRDYFDHISPEGVTPFQRMEVEGIRYALASENIACGQRSAIHAFEGFMNSNSHKQNILSNSSRLGVGVAFGGIHGVYFTQKFYLPR